MVGKPGPWTPATHPILPYLASGHLDDVDQARISWAVAEMLCQTGNPNLEALGRRARQSPEGLRRDICRLAGAPICWLPDKI